MSKFILFFVLLFATLAPYSSHASTAQKGNAFSIAAVVNDDVITRYDVESRVHFMIATSDAGKSPNAAKQLYPRAIRSLIDEQLQIQEARRNNIEITNEEIEQAILTIEKERGKAAGSLTQHLQKNGVDRATLDLQIRAQIAWNKLLQRRVVPELRVSDAEIKREFEHDNQQKRRISEVRLAALILPVETPEEEASTQQLAANMAKALQGGANLQSVVTRFKAPKLVATSPSWIAKKQLDPAIANAIKPIQDNGVTEPVRTAAGYQIIMVQGQRIIDYALDAEVFFKEIILNLSPQADKIEVDVLMSIAQEIRKNPGQCGSKTIAGTTSLTGLDFDVNYTRTHFSALSPQISPLVRPLKVGQISEPFATPEGIRLLKLCEKTDIEASMKNKEPFMRKLKEEKFKLETLKYMRDLRRDAFIDVRL